MSLINRFGSGLFFRTLIVFSVGIAGAQTFTPTGDAERDKQNWLLSSSPQISEKAECQTCLAGVLWPTLVQLQKFLVGYSSPVVLTGGSEPGQHGFSESGMGHRDGFKVDLRINKSNTFSDSLSTWIIGRSSLYLGGCRTDDNAPWFIAPNNMLFAMEYPVPSAPNPSTACAPPPSRINLSKTCCHWDILSSLSYVSVSAPTVSINVGETAQVSPVALDSRLNIITNTTWMFDYNFPDPDQQVATVDDNGLIMGIGTGSAVLVVSSGNCMDCQDTVDVDVKMPNTTDPNHPPAPGACASPAVGPCWRWDPTANVGAGAWIFVPPNGGSSDDETTQPITPVGSADPNGIVGPAGVGVNQYINGSVPEPYTIFFENLPTASAPAQRVVITDVVDPSRFDLSSLVLGPITFPASPGIAPPSFPLQPSGFSTLVDLRPATNLLVDVSVSMNETSGLITWTLQSVDPDTGMPPADPLVGFLPPSASGSVSFSARLKSSLTTGTTISDQASITFDANSAIGTPVWSNTLDSSGPTSRVTTLPPGESTASFVVSWAGHDVGAGIRDYSVYVSDSGGAPVRWLANTVSTGQKFVGIPGHTYGFYSIARDLAGNLESWKSTADATTIVTTPVSTIQCTGCYFLIDGVRATLAFSVAAVGSTSAFTFNYRSATQAVQFTSTTTSQVSFNGSTATFSGQGKLNGQSGFSFTAVAKDGGTAGSGLDTISILIAGPNNYLYSANGVIVGGDIVLK